MYAQPASGAFLKNAKKSLMVGEVSGYSISAKGLKARTGVPKLPANTETLLDIGNIQINSFQDTPSILVTVDEAMSDGGWSILCKETDTVTAYLNEGVYDDDYGENLKCWEKAEI